jgi:hypothetical protein
VPSNSSSTKLKLIFSYSVNKNVKSIVLNSLFVRHIYVICLWKTIFVCMYSRFYIILFIVHEFSNNKNITMHLMVVLHLSSQFKSNTWPVVAKQLSQIDGSVVSEPGSGFKLVQYSFFVSYTQLAHYCNVIISINAYGRGEKYSLVGKRGEKRRLGRHRHRWADAIKMDRKEVSGWSPVAGYCESGNEPSGSIKFRKFIS